MEGGDRLPDKLIRLAVLFFSLIMSCIVKINFL